MRDNQYKKIALFSCHKDPNYGSMLQAFALVLAIRKLGQEAEYINYSETLDPHIPSRVIMRIIKWPFKWIKDILYPIKPKDEFAFFDKLDFSSTMESFERFHNKYIPVSEKKYYSDSVREKLNINDYSNYIVGSDQTWSPNLYRPTKPYFLDFANLPKRNAYAPSLGTINLSPNYISLLKDKLSTFNHLSCREAVNSRFLSNLLKREVTHVLDPTLLLDQYDWDRITKEPSIKGDYILAYILGEKDLVINFAEQLGFVKKMPVYYVITRPKYFNMTHSLNGVGPDDWIGLIKKAKYVITDSYHGCLFCVNYNVNFYAFSKREGDINRQDNIRILEFLKILQLEHRFQDDTIATILDDIDFKDVNDKLDPMRRWSFEYLKNIIS